MIIKDGLFTSESVSDGHPDKICDQISDAILDECIMQDANSRVAIETGIKGHTLFIIGEITTKAILDYKSIALQVMSSLGHKTAKWGMNINDLNIIEDVTVQSPEISSGVDSGSALGAGDQGMMFGFACEETDQYLPLGLTLANQLMQQQKKIRDTESFNFLGPDAKAQVTIRYKDWEPVGIDSVVFSTQHLPSATLSSVREVIMEQIINPLLSEYLLQDAVVHINPAGPFTMGGPIVDAGLTGRKIIVDTYGGYARHGGGAFSGKDPTKVDRSAAYAARQLARQIVSLELASICEVRIAYAIGIARPLAISVETFGTGVLPDDELTKIFTTNMYDLFQPQVIIDRLNLKRPIYRESAAFGHFGRHDFPWEQPMESLLNDI